MKPPVVATFLAMEEGNDLLSPIPGNQIVRTSLIQIRGLQPLAGEQVAWLLLRDPDLNSCFSHDHVFAKSLRTCAVDASLTTDVTDYVRGKSSHAVSSAIFREPWLPLLHPATRFGRHRERPRA